MGSKRSDEFERAMRGVQKLARSNRVPKLPARAAVTAKLKSSVGASTSVDFTVRGELENGIAGYRSNMEPSIIAMLRDGKWRVEATLDLHGKKQSEAERDVCAFIESQFQRGVKVVRIVHGKGTHSEDGMGVLSRAVVQTLEHGTIRHRVRAFAHAKPRDGGRGALLVLLLKH